MDGRVLKNSMPPLRLLISNPNGSGIGTSAVTITFSGPNSDNPSRMLNPMPAIVNPPAKPTKNTRSATGVVLSKMLISLPPASSFMMPPIKVAEISPPSIGPFTLTPIEAMSVIGNLPSKSNLGSILTPSIVPENCRPVTPFRLSTLAESVMMKSSGWFSISAHSRPSALILIGSHDGHLKLPPDAAPTLINTPKPGLVLKLPSPRNAKLRASPPSSKPPMFTRAPSAAKDTSSSLSPAPVLSMKSRAVRARKLPSLISIVSAWNLKASTLPLLKVSSARSASVFCVPSAFLSSDVFRSLIDAETGLPGKNFAPPVAK